MRALALSSTRTRQTSEPRDADACIYTLKMRTHTARACLMETFKWPLCSVLSPILRLHVSYLRSLMPRKTFLVGSLIVGKCFIHSPLITHIYWHHRTEVGISLLSRVESHSSNPPGKVVRPDIIPSQSSRCLENAADAVDYHDVEMHISTSCPKTPWWWLYLPLYPMIHLW